MQPAKNIRRWFKHAELAVRQDADNRVFKDMVEAQQKKMKDDSPAMPVSMWRMTMRNPISKLAIAAVLAIACLVGVSLWRGTGSGIALADVLAHVEQLKAYTYQTSHTIASQKGADKSPTSEIRSRMLVSQEYGMRASTLDPNTGEASTQEYLLLKERRRILIMPDEKRYLSAEFDETLAERKRREIGDPRAVLKQILNCAHESLGRSIMDDVEVEGYRTTDPKYLGESTDQVDVRLWVDVRTRLPVRSEEIVWNDRVRMHTICTDFQWNVPVDAAEFEPVIPGDYASVTGEPLRLPAVDEEAVIRGLTLYVELANRYPEGLDGNTLSRSVDYFPEVRGLSREERQHWKNDWRNVGQALNRLAPIIGLGLFYEQLVQDKKDTAYYGKTVTPQDIDKVLMRWKVSDTEYRVIFGDLHAETVTPERLADLEKAMPR